MNRSFFLTAAVSAVSIFRPLFARAEDPTERVRLEPKVEASGWREPMWFCGSAVVWLDIVSGTYYYEGERRYGRTKRGAYACEKEALAAGNRASRKFIA